MNINHSRLASVIEAEAIMNSIDSHSVERQRALTIRGAKRQSLARLRRLGVFVLCGLAFAGISVRAEAQIVVPRDFPTIQAAVAAAAPGAKIKVRRGIYTEQIVIAKNLTLEGDGIGQTIIQAPATLIPDAQQFGRPVASVVRITDGAQVKLSGVTVSGPLPCSDLASGIRVVKAARLELKDSYVTRMRPEGGPCLSGPPVGRGIALGAPANIQDLQSGLFGSTGHGDIKNVTIDQYQTTGITVVAPAGANPSTATISESTFIGGASPFFPVAQIGIQLAAATIAQVKESTVTGNACNASNCGPDIFTQAQGVGILASINAPNSVEISENRVSDNDVGIYQSASPNRCVISENKLDDNRFFGIIIRDGDGTTSENTIKGGQVGIAVVAGSVNTVGVLREDRIKMTTVAPVQEIGRNGFTATAIVVRN